MHKSIYFIAVVFILLVTALSCNYEENPRMKAGIENKDSLISHGAYLVTIMGCDDCHSPKKMGPNGPELNMDLRLSGFPSGRPIPSFDSNVVKKGMTMFNEDLTAAAGPWGISFAGNLTSDATGAGSWTEKNFITALRKGKFKGIENGRDLLPPMPWQNISHMSDYDLKAIYAFLQTTKPVENVVPPAKMFSELK